MKKFYKNPLTLLAIGVIVIAASTVGATRAAMISQSEADRVNFATATFSVDILGDVDGNTLYFHEMNEDNPIEIGKLYEKNVTVKNTSGGNYDEYIRVVVKKSWNNNIGTEEEPKYEKNISLSPKLIEIKVADGWYINKDETTDEQAVYYKLTPVKKDEEVPFITGVKINDKVIKEVKHDVIGTTITNEYSYDGACIGLSVQADAVQTNNSKDAIHAAWGIGESFTTVDSEENESTVSFTIVDAE